MAVMGAAAAPEQALMGLMRSSSTGAVFVATGARISPFGNACGGSGALQQHHHLDWNPQTAIANSLESPSSGPVTDWEHLLDHPGDGLELPLWSSKAAVDHDVSLLGDPLVKHVEDVHSPTPQPQLLEAVEGSTIATATANALVAAAATATVAAGPPENPCPAAAKASPPRSPLLHGVDLPNTNSRKRKKDRPSPNLKCGEQEGVNLKTGKRCGRGRERSSSETSGESGGAGTENQHHPDHHQRDSLPKPDFPKLDYIHVRARRGQATDSHSLAERVRREKMSERMKFLQDLVPGCRKVTGKAVMLDEIINYVQSLQRQVESLSMKLAAVSPAQSSHWTLESLLSNKEILQAQQFSNTRAVATPAAAGAFAMERIPLPPPPAAAAAQQHLPFGFDFRGSTSGSLLEHGRRSLETLSNPSFADLTTSMSPFHSTGLQCTGPDGELQSVVHMGLHQRGQLGSFAGQLQCQLPVGRLKVEF